MFSKDKLFDLAKSIVKLAVLFYVVYDSLKDEWGLVVNIYQLELVPALELIVNTVINAECPGSRCGHHKPNPSGSCH